jgi:hypothetical protein
VMGRPRLPSTLAKRKSTRFREPDRRATTLCAARHRGSRSPTTCLNTRDIRRASSDRRHPPVIRARHTLGDDTTDDRIISPVRDDPADRTLLLLTPHGSAGGGFGERGSAERTTACRDWHIAETFRAFFGGRVGSDFSAPHSGENRVHR